MKAALFCVPLAYLLTSGGSWLRADAIHWVRDYASGINLALERQAPVLIYFRTARCSSCDGMEHEIENNPTVLEAMRQVVPIRLDLQKDAVVAGRYAARDAPTIVIVDPWGNPLVRMERPVTPDGLLDKIKSVPSSFLPVAGDAAAIRRDPQLFEPWLRLSAFYRQAGFPSIARGYAERALRNPRAAGDVRARNAARVALGLVALHMNEMKEAQRIFEEARKEIDPENEPSILLGLGKTYVELNKLDQARVIFEEVAIKYPKTAYGRVALENLERIR